MEIDWKKKYNEALEKIKRYTIDEYGCTRLKPTDIFPELSESDDERIRKGLIEALKASKTVGELKFILPEPTREECIAYLEKQKTANEKESFTWTKHDEAVRKEAIACLEDWKSVIPASGFADYKNILAWLKEELPEKQKEQIEELSTHLNGVMQEYVKSGKDEEEQKHRLKCYQLFWDALGDSEFFEQKEQKPISKTEPIVDGLTEFEKQVSYLIASVIDKEHKYSEGYVKWVAQSLMSHAIKNQKLVEWSKEDKTMLNNLIWSVHMKSISPLDEMDDRDKYKKYEKFLASLPERFGLQPQQEWSDEDELMRTAVIQTLETLGGRGTTGMQIDWMKSLRPQSHWRPSEEQMGRLISIVSALRKDDCDDMADAIAEIYHGLEKMM